MSGAGGTYGGFAPQPERYGGGKRRVEYILDALLHSDQTEIGLDTTQGENVWIEELATARAIDAAWSTNARGANEFDPRRTQDMLPRWETIFGVTPPQKATPPQRRAKVTFKFQALGKDPTPSQINDDLTFLGTTPDGASTVFAGVTYTSSSAGPVYFPGNNGTTVASVFITNGGSGYGGAPTVNFSSPPAPGTVATATCSLTGGVVTSVFIVYQGTGYLAPPLVTFGSGTATGLAVMNNPNPYDPHGVTIQGVSPVDWWTGVLNLAVEVTQPSTMSTQTFNDLVGEMSAYLDGVLPAWMTFSFYQTSGFFLDQGNFGVEALAS